MLSGGSYKLRVHSLRKFFKTQLLAPGIQPDYVDYMIGHRVGTYHDVSSKPEKLRRSYATANLTLTSKPEMSKLDMLKTFARSLGIDPEKAIWEDMLVSSHRVEVAAETEEERRAALLSSAIKEALKRELLADLPPFQSPEFSIQPWVGGAARI